MMDPPYVCCCSCGDSSVVDRQGRSWLLSFGISRSAPGVCGDRKIEGPSRFPRHQSDEFFCAPEAFRHLGNDLIVDMKDDGIASRFDPQHRLGEKITGDAGDDVLDPQAPVSAFAVSAIFELSGRIVG